MKKIPLSNTEGTAASSFYLAYQLLYAGDVSPVVKSNL